MQHLIERIQSLLETKKIKTLDDYDLSDPKQYKKVEKLLKSIGPKLNEYFWESGTRVKEIEALAKADPRFKRTLEGLPKRQGGYAALIKKPMKSVRGKQMVPLTSEERKLLSSIIKVHTKTRKKYITWRDYLRFLEDFAGVEKLLRGTEQRRGMPVTRRMSIAVAPGASPYEQAHAAQVRSIYTGKRIVKNVGEYLMNGGARDDFEREEPPEDLKASGPYGPSSGGLDVDDKDRGRVVTLTRKRKWER